jgi:hypothetical protein
MKKLYTFKYITDGTIAIDDYHSIDNASKDTEGFLKFYELDKPQDHYEVLRYHYINDTAQYQQTHIFDVPTLNKAIDALNAQIKL